MQVTRDVITDLLPLYLAGEASEDTRALVQVFLEQDPEFAQWVKAGAQVTLPLAIPTSISEETEMKSLAETKRQLKRRSLLMSAALLFSGLTVAFTIEPTGVRWLWADSPAMAVVMLVVAVISWVGFFTTRWRLKATGL